MLKNNNSIFKNLLIFSFILCEILLYIFVVLAKKSNNILCLTIYCTLLFCFAFTLINKRPVLIFIGIVFTALADTMLEMFEPIKQLEGLCFFFIVQTCYFIYFLVKYKKIILNISIRIIALIISVIITLIILKENVTPIPVMSVLYIVSLFLNIILAVIHIKQEWLFLIGLILFFCCDITLGLQLMGDFISVSENAILKFFGELDCWLFYLPSQVIITLKVALTKKLPTNKISFI